MPAFYMRIKMTTFESKIKAIAASDETIYTKLSDLKNLESFKSEINDEKIKEIRIEEDTIFIKVDMLGEVGLKLIEKEPNKTLKFEGVNAPIQLNLWIQIKEAAANDSRLKLTLKADIPFMIKAMASKPIQEFLEKLADALASIPY